MVGWRQLQWREKGWAREKHVCLVIYQSYYAYSEQKETVMKTEVSVLEKNYMIHTLKKEAPLWLLVVFGTYLLTGILLLLLAFLVYQFGLGEKAVGIFIIVIYAAVNFCGGFFMGKKKKVKKYLAGFVMGILYFAFLVLVSLLCNHGLQDLSGNFFTTMIICTGSGMLGGMLS